MRTFILGCTAAALIACGGRTERQGGLEGPSAFETSAAYPTGSFGWNVGDLAPNMAFTGYLHVDPSTTIDPSERVGTVRLSDFYDADGSRGLTHLVVTIHDEWCGPSVEQEDFTNGADSYGANPGKQSFARDYAARGVRFLTLLQQGPQWPLDATVTDLASWAQKHEARVSEALLSSDELMLDVVEAEVPYTFVIDARTMRIEVVWVGFLGDLAKLDALLN